MELLPSSMAVVVQRFPSVQRSDRVLAGVFSALGYFIYFMLFIIFTLLRRRRGRSSTIGRDQIRESLMKLKNKLGATDS